MSTHRIRRTAVDAYRWDDQPKDQWPTWLQFRMWAVPHRDSYRDVVPTVRPGAPGGKHFLILRHDDAYKEEFQVYPGEWIVLTFENVVTSYSDQQFQLIFEAQ